MNPIIEEHAGRVIHVHSANCAEVEFKLGFDGLLMRKRIVLDGLHIDALTEPQKSAGTAALIYILGGKDVAVQVTGFLPRRLIGRVMLSKLTERMKVSLPSFIVEHRMYGPCFDVNAYMQARIEQGINVEVIKTEVRF